MNEPNHNEPDPILSFLEVSPPSGADGPFRQAVLEQTLRLLRRRRWLKRASLLVALAACYVAGIITVHLFAPRAANESGAMARTSTSADAPEAVKQAPPARAVEDERTVPASVLEERALVSPSPKPHLFRLAGDRYLQEDGDAPSALRCYRNWLASAPPADLTISPDDNWLVMALKLDKRKEEAYEKSPQ